MRQTSGVYRSVENMVYGTFAFGDKAGMLTPDSVNSLKSAISGLNAEQAALTLSTKGLTVEQQKQVLVEAGLLSSSERMSASLVAEALADNGLDKELQDSILIRAQLMNQESKLLITENAITEGKLRAILAEKGIKGAKAETLIASILQTGQNTKEALSWDVLRTKIKMAAIEKLRWLVTTPAGWATLTIGAIVGVTAAVVNYNKKLEESRQEMIETGKEAAKYTKDLDGLIEEYRKLGKDDVIDGSEIQKAREIQEKINELLGEEANNINLANGNYKEQIKILKDLQYQTAKDKNFELETAYTAAKDSLVTEAKKTYINAGWVVTDEEVDAVNELKTIEGVDEYLHTYKNPGTGNYNAPNVASFKIDTSSPEAIIKSYEKMIELQDVLEDKHRDEIKSGGALEDFYNELSDAIDGLSTKIGAYKEALNSYNLNEAVVQFNETEFGGVKGAMIQSEDQLNSWIASMQASTEITDDVKYNLIGLAKTSYPELSKAIDKSAAEFVRGKIANGSFKGSLAEVASQCGMTTKSLGKMILDMINLNETKLNLSQQIGEIIRLRAAMGLSEFKDSDIYDAGFEWVRKGTYALDGKEYTMDEARYKVIYDTTMDELKKFGGDTNNNTSPYTPSGTKDKTNEVLDNYLKDAENRYKIHQDEAKYIQELQHAFDNLTKNEKERLDITGKINEAYRDLADNRIKDIEHQIDLAKELNGYADVTDYYKHIQKIAHEEANRLRAMGYDDNSNEIQDLQKKWWDAQNSIVDWRWENSNNWINDRNIYNDWALFNDSEVDAWERVIKWLNEDYPNDLEKIKEAEKNLFEARKKEFNKATDFHSSYFDSRISILEAQYELENSIAEARHELNKELETSKTMYEYLDEETRKLLFNQEDYNELAEELLSIEKRGARLQRQYEKDLKKATLETVEDITANYERQYETLMKSYEIAKADLEIAKKKQQLNNVLNERNVRMFLDGQWRWVANTEEVARAKSELADAEYAKRVAKAGLKQQESINNLTLQQDQLGIVVKKFEGGVITLDEAVADAAEAIGKLPKALQEMYKNASKGNTSSFSSDGSSSLKGSSSGGGNKSSSSSGGNSSSTMNITVKTGNILPESAGGKVTITPFSSGDSSSNGVNTTDQYVTSGSGIINSNPNWDGKKKGSVGIEKHADGTRYTPGGLTLMGEEGSEIYITASGRLIPINQPTIGNIPSGGVVFNREQMNGIRSLWDMSNMKLSSDKTQIERQPQQIDQSQDNRIIINGMTVDSGSSDGQALISALRRYVSNH